MATFQARPGIQLTSMPQLSEVEPFSNWRDALLTLNEALDREDDWTGLTDAAARRKRQNRLNVRAYRRRKALESQSQPQALIPYTTRPTKNALETTEAQPRPVAWWIEDQQTATLLPPSAVNKYPNPRTPLIPYLPISPDQDPDPKSRTSQPVQILFPLSLDHLITIIQYNVIRATLTNYTLLSLLHTIPPECTAALSIIPMATPPTSLAIPPSLQPTALQLATPHRPWIDAVPHPVWRDNLIRAAGEFDEDDMCDDACGGLWEGFPDSECQLRGVIAWATPWDVEGWEVSEGFARKWAWVLKGCPEVLRATNRWRALRGEEELVVEL